MKTVAKQLISLNTNPDYFIDRVIPVRWTDNVNQGINFKHLYIFKHLFLWYVKQTTYSKVRFKNIIWISGTMDGFTFFGGEK